MRAKSPWLSIVAVILAVGMLSGCQRINEGIPAPSVGEAHAFSNYWANRGHDAMDIVRLQWGFPCLLRPSHRPAERKVGVKIQQE